MSFWADDFWADGFWADDFWTGLSSAGVPSSVRFEPIAQSSVRTNITFGPHILLEDGTGIILLETGDELLVEDLTPAATATFKSTLSGRVSFET